MSRFSFTTKYRKKWLIVIFILAIGGAYYLFTRQRKVDFNAEIKPIFNKNCIICHGGVRHQANFSLLFRSDALAVNKSGKRAIIPGDPEHSEMIRRLTLKDPEDRMPFKHPPLAPSDISLLRKWIKEGAQWGDHWAYVAVQPVVVPRSNGKLLGLFSAGPDPWAANDIDYFILDKLKREKLEHGAIADKATLLRRLSLDLTGLPPSPALAGQYLHADDDKAYERLVDSLLASPHFGEKWASMWLDIARYADSKGYEKDGQRPEIWKYRDWVIKAFNSDKPYNTFLVEQLAGDLLPAPADEQLVATGFHRNTMTNDEGGTDNEEFRTAAVLDRVNTTWQGLMGTTFGCVQCHSHPYDPFRHDEYYKFLAFFNNSRDEDTFDDYPLLREFDSTDIGKLAALSAFVKEQGSPDEARAQVQFLKTWQPSINSNRADQFVNSALQDTKFLTFRQHGSARFQDVSLSGKQVLIARYNAYADGGTLTIHLDSLKGPVLLRMNVSKTKDWEMHSAELPRANGVHDLHFSYDNPRLKKPTDDGLQIDWLHFGHHLPGEGRPGFAEAQKFFWELAKKKIPGIPVMMENPAELRRETHVFERGNWLVKGALVDAAVPHSLNPFPAGAPPNRLGLAMWMTDEKNPLVSRTIVNRLWEQLFGTGLVETLEDMGTQGIAPTHRELLDYLAWKFMHDDHWSIKQSLKYLVMSSTYRQESRIGKDQLEKDPFNKWYGRGPRVRLSAEQVRDQALFCSGLLSGKMYGQPVMPWQPAGIWHSPYSAERWVKSPGQDQYRRAIYTYWKRTAPFPSMIAFDGASREVCSARRIRTNTPLQALVTLNDSVYLEAARGLAIRMSSFGDHAIDKGYELLMYKPIEKGKADILQALYKKAVEKFAADPEKACAMMGESGPRTSPQAAAMTVVAGALLNLDEVITKN